MLHPHSLTRTTLFLLTGVHFFGGLPRLGALFVAAISPSAREKPVQIQTQTQIQTLLCADTLRTDRGGSGQPFSEEDQAFLTALAGAMARATEEGDAKSEVLAEKVKAQVDSLKVISLLGVFDDGVELDMLGFKA